MRETENSEMVHVPVNVVRWSPVRFAGGFTLLEVLVAIGVISILAGILLASLRAARQTAKATACRSNLKQTATGWQMYLNDSDGYFLKGVNLNWNYGGKQGNGSRMFGIDPSDPTWQIPKPLNRQLGLDEVVYDGADVFHCPSDRGGGDVPTIHYDHKGTSYVTNLMLIGPTRLNVRFYDPCLGLKIDLNRLIPNLRRDMIFNPSQVVLMGDAGWLNTLDFESPYSLDWHRKPSRHNVSFVDGHAEFVHVRKGLHVTPEYSVVPFERSRDQALACQKEVGS